MTSEEVECAIPVTVGLTKEVGVFYLSEPKGSTTISALNRAEFEKKLSSFILKQLFEHGGENNLDQQFCSIGDVSGLPF